MVFMKKTIIFPDESKYVGEVKNGKPHGKGTLTYPEKGGKYVGQWKNGKFHGKGKLTYSDGGIYVGKFKNGKCDGYGDFKIRGQKYSGNWKNGKRHGHGTLKQSGGGWHHDEEYTGEFRNGVYHGHGILKEGDEEYTGEFTNGYQTQDNQHDKNKDNKTNKKIKYTFSYLKKHLDISELLNYLDTGDDLTNILTYVIWSFSAKQDSEEFENSIDKIDKQFYLSVNKTSFAEKLLKYQFDGTLLPKLSNNFKLEIYFEMGNVSRALISSKIGKKFYHISALREWDKKRDKPLSFKKPSGYMLEYCHVVDVLKKKPNKAKFFELIMKDSEGQEDLFMEENKSMDYEQRERLWEEIGYVSQKGVNYLTLYKKGKL